MLNGAGDVSRWPRWLLFLGWNSTSRIDTTTTTNPKAYPKEEELMTDDNVEKIPVLIDHKWISPEAHDLFELVKGERDSAYMKMLYQLGDAIPEEATTTQMIQARQIMDPRQRYEIEMAWEPTIAGYEREMVKVIDKYSVPMAKLIDRPANWDTEATPDDEATAD